MMTIAQDLYPSRVSDCWKIFERQDPVVPDTSRAGPLSRGQVESFAENGFLILEGLFSNRELNSWKQQAARLQQEFSGRDDLPDNVIQEPGDKRTVRSIFAIHRDDEVFHNLCKDPRLVDIVEELLATECYIHQSRINYKPAFEGREFYWHSDFETWHTEDGMPRMRAISCMINLSPNYPYNGSLMFIPKSHDLYISCVGKTPEDHYKKSLRRQEYGVPPTEALTMLIERGGIELATAAAGSVVLFDCNIMHGSSSNITPYPRDNVFFVYNSVQNGLVEPFEAPRPRPQFIAERDFTPVRELMR